MALNLTEKDIENPEVLGEKLFTLTEIIISRHFYASSSQHFDDMRSIGVLKALEVINKGHFDSSKGHFASFIYFHVRNEIHNFLYHENKRKHADLDTLIDKGEDDKYFECDGKIYLSYSLVHCVCMSFMKVFGENIENLVINQLMDMDFEIEGRVVNDNHAFIYNYDPIEAEYGKEAEEEIISRLIGIILWKRNEKYIG